MPPDLDADEQAALIDLLRDTIYNDRFPYSPRIKRLMAILAKLEPASMKVEPLPPTKPPGERGAALTKKRRR